MTIGLLQTTYSLFIAIGSYDSYATRLEAITSRVEAIAISLEAILGGTPW